jgi:hypothetical protein
MNITVLKEKINNECSRIVYDEHIFDKIQEKKLKLGLTSLELINIKKERRKLVLEEDKSVEEANLIIKEKYNYEFKYNLFYIDLMFSNYYIYFTCLKKDIPSKLNSFYENNIQFFERFYIRMMCLKNGLNYNTIENIIKRNYSSYYNTFTISKEDKLIFYTCFKTSLNLKDEDKDIILTKGRPNLHPDVKLIIKKYKNIKSVERVKIYRKMSTVVKNVFNKDDINLFKRLVDRHIDDENKKKEMVEKCEQFIKLL